MSRNLKKKWKFGFDGWTKDNIDFSWPQGIYFLENYDELSEPVPFDQKLRYFTDQSKPNGGPQKWMLQTVRAEKVDEKNRSFV